MTFKAQRSWIFAFATVVSLVASTTSVAADCSRLLKKVSLLRALEALQTISPEVWTAKQTPGKKEIDILKKLMVEFESANRQISDRRMLDAMTPDLVNLVRKFRVQVPSSAPGTEYRPLEYELWSYLQWLASELNALFPEAIIVGMPKLPPSFRRETLTREAIDLVQANHLRFLKVFKESSGYASPQAWFDQVAASDLVNLKETIALFQSDRIELSLNAPEEVRFWSPITGFQNQHTTGASRAFYDPVAHRMVESGMLRVADQTYSAYDDELKVKYGSLVLDSKSTGTRVHSDLGYGDDRYIFKLKQIKDRVTFTLDDSYDQYLTRMMPAGQTRAATDLPNSNWDVSFIPLDYSGLAALTHRIKQEKGAVPYLSGSMDFQERLAYLPKTIRPRFTPTSLPQFEDASGYIELQYWGPLNLDDVAAFEFGGTPPSGEFLAELLVRGIELRKRECLKKWRCTYEIYTPSSDELRMSAPFIQKIKRRLRSR